MMSEKAYWDTLDMISSKHPTSREDLDAAIPSAFIEDHLEEVATIAAALIGAGYLPHQVHSMLMPLATPEEKYCLQCGAVLILGHEFHSGKCLPCMMIEFQEQEIKDFGVWQE